MYNKLEELARESVKNQPDEEAVDKDKFGKRLAFPLKIIYYISGIFNKWVDQDSPFQHYGLRHK
ncbi:MAG: hypothetical protein ABIH65_03180 [Nanoarchaeota archaeon]